WYVVFGRLRTGDRVDLGLSVVDDVGRVALPVVAELHDARTGVDEAAQDRALRHDTRVVAGVRRSRHDRGERVQVVRATSATELASLDELVSDSDDVGWFTVRVQRQDRFEDELVFGDVEIGALKRLDHIGNGVFRQQHSAERTLLGEEVVRWDAL